MLIQEKRHLDIFFKKLTTVFFCFLINAIQFIKSFTGKIHLNVKEIMPGCYGQPKPFSKNTSVACHNTVCKRLSWLHRPIFTQHSMTCKEIPLVSQNGMCPKEEHHTNHVASQWGISEINFSRIRNCSCPCSLMKLQKFQLVACMYI